MTVDRLKCRLYLAWCLSSPQVAEMHDQYRLIVRTLSWGRQPEGWGLSRRVAPSFELCTRSNIRSTRYSLYAPNRKVRTCHLPFGFSTLPRNFRANGTQDCPPVVIGASDRDQSSWKTIEPKLARKPDDRWDEVTLRENTPPPPAYIVDTLTSQRISNSHAIDDVEAQKAEAHQREGHLAREKEISRLFGGGGAGKGSEDSDDADAETLGEKDEVASRRRGWLARHWKICFCLVPLIAVCTTLGALLYIRNHSPLSRRDT
ncbi:hypothetical protein DFP72DRAFT_1039505 [Ephemerocybe angulata]|uniref:Uncharacterized protein n=1 Tax=Ephemerocybe angulata TaxID=980116 RepID=A0A8H6MEL8_9AGAR|nr:hypothetical protein DFP72DRAFT_1039505 [Tulosesus angulatus]